MDSRLPKHFTTKSDPQRAHLTSSRNTDLEDLTRLVTLVALARCSDGIHVADTLVDDALSPLKAAVIAEQASEEREPTEKPTLEEAARLADAGWDFRPT